MLNFKGFIFGLLLSSWAAAQDVEFTASASPDILHVGEQFNLIYTANQQITSLELPEIRDFKFLGGPSQGHSQSVYSENGKVTTTSTYQYTYFFQAIKEGKFSIPAATAKINNKEIRSNAVSVEIVAAQTQPSQQNRPQTGTDESSLVDGNRLFIRLIPDKNEAYIGEQITVTIKIYSQIDLSGIDPSFKGPDFTGFFTEEVEVPPLRNLEREVYNGDIYGTGVLRRAVIIPQHTGEIVLNSFDVDVSVRQEVRRRTSDPFFDEFFFPEFENVQYTLRSSPVGIRVKPLPEGSPDSFSGAVGNFRLSSSLNKTDAVVNEPLTLKYTITGTGNLKLMDELLVDIPPGLEKYDPVVNTDLTNALSGTKTFEYLIVPQAEGQFTIPPAAFTYFSPATGEYYTLHAQPFALQVEKGQFDSLSPSFLGVIKEDVQLLNQDIHFIKTGPSNLMKINSFFAGSASYYLVLVLLLLAFVIMMLIRQRMISYNADPVQVRKRKADKYARKRLKHCTELLEQKKYLQFYDVLLSALWRYLSEKLNIPLARLSRETARESLQGRNVDAEVIEEFFRITGECEVARYAPSAENSGNRQMYLDALDIISRIQQKLR